MKNKFINPPPKKKILKKSKFQNVGDVNFGERKVCRLLFIIPSMFRLKEKNVCEI